jgi:hypothetical protein
MYKTFCLLAILVVTYSAMLAQNIEQNSETKNVTDSINRSNQANSIKIEQTNKVDSFKQATVIINKTDTVFVYVKRVFNPFHFLVKDSLHSPRLLLRPFLENGIYFLRNTELKTNYSTQSIFYYGFGFQIGHPQTFKIIPFTQISFSKYTIDKVLYQNTKADSSFSMKQIVLGVILPVYSSKDNFIRMKCGYSVSFIKETFHFIDDSPFGLQVGLGIERRFIGNTRMYTDFSYLYQKSSNPNFKDFDMTKLALGFVL